MLLDYFGSLVGFMEKWTKSTNLGKFRGPMPRHRDPTQQRKSTPRRGREVGVDKPRVRQGVAKLRHNVAVLHRGVATVHSMEIFVFCHVLLFRYSEDLYIGLIRTL